MIGNTIFVNHNNHHIICKSHIFFKHIYSPFPYRIHGQSITYTQTGRISMTEPNLQNVAKNFVVTLDGSYIRYLTVLK